MNIMKLLFRKNDGKKESGGFSDFLLHASPEKQIELFKEAARKANQDQRSVVERYDEIQTKNAS